MSKLYVLNPETGRLVDKEGRTGLKIINQLMKKGQQIKYQLTKSNNTCGTGEKKVLRKIDGEKKRICVPKATIRAKCPKGTINYKGDCINKKDKPKGTRGRPKTTKPQQKKTQAQAQKILQQQSNQMDIFQKYDKIVKEIKSVYTPIKDRVDEIYDIFEDDPSDGYPDDLFIKFQKLKTKMPEFLKFSGFSDKRIKQIIKSCEESIEIFDYLANPVEYLKYILNSILVGEPSLDMKPLQVFLGTSNLDMDQIKPSLTKQRLLSYNAAIDQN